MKTEHGNLVYMSGFDKSGYRLLENAACENRGRRVPRRRLCGEESIACDSINYPVFENVAEWFDERKLLVIYDMVGNILLKQELLANKRTSSINVSSFSSAVYTYRYLVNSTFIHSGKLVIE